MLGSFKLRMLIVIVIATLAGLAMQSDNRSEKMISPVLRYVMRDYGVQKNLATYLENMYGQSKGEGVPVSGDVVMQKPCAVGRVIKHYGWYWNEERGKQEFNSGLILGLPAGSLVRPVLNGRVESISADKDGRRVKVLHLDGLVSIYGGLQEVLVKQGAEVEAGEVLGKSGPQLYFELQNGEGPLNPENIFAGT